MRTTALPATKRNRARHWIAAAALILLNSHAQASTIRIIDGDTVALGSERIRLLGVDAPEIFHPRCEAEKQLGNAATEALRQIIGSGTPTIERQGQDRYGRTLARISVSGTDAGEALIAKGLARRWESKPPACHPRCWCN